MYSTSKSHPGITNLNGLCGPVTSAAEEFALLKVHVIEARRERLKRLYEEEAVM